MRYILFLLPAFIYANTTMCYKNNWNDPSTIESEKLDGGECKGEKSIGQMKNEGWSVDDIKISSGDKGFNYIYIFKYNKTKQNDNNTSLNIDYKQLAVSIEENKKDEQAKENLKEGKKLYVKLCEQCHGKKGELRAKGTSRPLNSLSIDDIKESIKGYNRQDYDRGLAILMRPYANLVNNIKLEQIKLYLDSVNR